MYRSLEFSAKYRPLELANIGMDQALKVLYRLFVTRQSVAVYLMAKSQIM